MSCTCCLCTVVFIILASTIIQAIYACALFYALACLHVDCVLQAVSQVAEMFITLGAGDREGSRGVCYFTSSKNYIYSCTCWGPAAGSSSNWQMACCAASSWWEYYISEWIIEP